MSEDSEQPPPTPATDRRRVAAGTWIWIGIVFVAALAVIVWAATQGLPTRGPG